MWRAQRITRQSDKVVKRLNRYFADEAAPKKEPLQKSNEASGFPNFLKIVGLSVPLSGAAGLGYAWYSPEFRLKVEQNIPYSKDLLAKIFPNQTPEKDVKPKIVKQPDFLPEITTVAPILNVQDEHITPSPASTPTGLFQTISDNKTEEKIGPKDVVLEKVRNKDEDDKADNAALEVAVHNLVETNEKLSNEAVSAQKDVTKAIQNHTKLLKQAMDDTSDILNKDAQWDAVAIAFKERENATIRADHALSESKFSMEKLKEVISEGKSNKVTEKNPALSPASQTLNKISKDISKATTEVKQAESEAKAVLKYKDLVERGRRQFQREVESLMPEVKFSDSKKMTEDELNSLIAHAHRRIEQLQKQLAEQEALERQRLMTALDAVKHEDEVLTQEALNAERKNILQELDTEKQKIELEYLIQQEAEVRKHLARQAAAHSDHLKDALSMQREELNKNFEKEMTMKLLDEREKFQHEVASWISRVKGIESALDERAESEKLARAAQNLWLACVAFNSIIRFGKDNEPDSLSPLGEAVDEVRGKAYQHPFVETVLSAMPKQALERGIYTEEALKERFTKVASVGKRLGFIMEENAPLHKYIFSFVFSCLVAPQIKAKTETGLVDLSTLDNFSIIATAQYWLDKGNLEMAVKFMNQLKGECRYAASDWINEARLLLEVKQIAHTLSAHASASGLSVIF